MPDITKLSRSEEADGHRSRSPTAAFEIDDVRLDARDRVAISDVEVLTAPAVEDSEPCRSTRLTKTMSELERRQPAVTRTWQLAGSRSTTPRYTKV